MSLIVVGRQTCPFTRRAVSIGEKSRFADVLYYDIEKDDIPEENIEALKKTYNTSTIPIIFLAQRRSDSADGLGSDDGEEVRQIWSCVNYIGGCDDLERMLSAGNEVRPTGPCTQVPCLSRVCRR